METHKTKGGVSVSASTSDTGNAAALYPTAGMSRPLRNMTDRNASSDAVRGKPSLAMTGLVLVEMIIGYEWLISGVTKFVRGGFPSGLGKQLLEKSEGAPAWYGGLMQGTFIPYARILGYLIEISEVLAGVVLLAGPFLWLCVWGRLSDRLREVVLFLTAVAAIGGTILAINFHLANGAAHPWLIPGTGFDEGIDLDSVLPAIQIVIATVSIIFLKRLRLEQGRVADAPEVTGPD